MQEKRIGKRLVLLSWNRYQQLLAAEKALQDKEKTFTRWALELLNEYRETHTGGVVRK